MRRLPIKSLHPCESGNSELKVPLDKRDPKLKGCLLEGTTGLNAPDTVIDPGETVRAGLLCRGKSISVYHPLWWADGLSSSRDVTMYAGTQSITCGSAKGCNNHEEESKDTEAFCSAAGFVKGKLQRGVWVSKPCWNVIRRKHAYLAALQQALSKKNHFASICCNLCTKRIDMPWTCLAHLLEVERSNCIWRTRSLLSLQHATNTEGFEQKIRCRPYLIWPLTPQPEQARLHLNSAGVNSSLADLIQSSALLHSQLACVASSVWLIPCCFLFSSASWIPSLPRNIRLVNYSFWPNKLSFLYSWPPGYNRIKQRC